MVIERSGAWAGRPWPTGTTVLRVYLRATFATTRHAVEYWRNRTKVDDTMLARVRLGTEGSPRPLAHCRAPTCRRSRRAVSVSRASPYETMVGDLDGAR
jgi:hypothetical protein